MFCIYFLYEPVCACRLVFCLAVRQINCLEVDDTEMETAFVIIALKSIYRLSEAQKLKFMQFHVG